MKFTLTYDGELKSNGTPQQKAAIRRELSPQIEELWLTSDALASLQKNRYVAKAPHLRTEVHHSVPDNREFTIPLHRHDEYIDVLAPISMRGWTFRPLIRDSLSLRCGLRITFLRKGDVGKVYQGGDLDNRLKTLFDALAMPQHAEQLPEDAPIDAAPVYCLLQDDSLISGINIETDRLLTRPNSSQHEVRLIIEVDVRVMQARLYNQVFLGG